MTSHFTKSTLRKTVADLETGTKREGRDRRPKTPELHCMVESPALRLSKRRQDLSSARPEVSVLEQRTGPSRGWMSVPNQTGIDSRSASPRRKKSISHFDRDSKLRGNGLIASLNLLRKKSRPRRCTHEPGIQTLRLNEACFSLRTRLHSVVRPVRRLPHLVVAVAIKSTRRSAMSRWRLPSIPASILEAGQAPDQASRGRRRDA